MIRPTSSNRYVSNTKDTAPPLFSGMNKRFGLTLNNALDRSAPTSNPVYCNTIYWLSLRESESLRRGADMPPFKDPFVVQFLIFRQMIKSCPTDG